MRSQRLNRLLNRPDFKRNPAQALLKRAAWRLRWMVNDQPWLLPLGDLEIAAPKGGAGALIYYLGRSEPEITDFISHALNPGMTFWDIGAHIGEYSLLGASKVGPQGHVDAFEPQPAMTKLLRANVRHNRFTTIEVHEAAVTDTEGRATLRLTDEPSTAFLSSAEGKAGTSVDVKTISLDSFVTSSGRWPHLIKVDVEGAELSVLRGATSILNAPPERAPIWIMEFEPENCRRCGYEATELLAYFQSCGFECSWLDAKGGLEKVSSLRSEAGRTVIATKRPL